MTREQENKKSYEIIEWRKFIRGFTHHTHPEINLSVTKHLKITRANQKNKKKTNKKSEKKKKIKELYKKKKKTNKQDIHYTKMQM